jgi:hypothetical protein
MYPRLQRAPQFALVSNIASVPAASSQSTCATTRCSQKVSPKSPFPRAGCSFLTLGSSLYSRAFPRCSRRPSLPSQFPSRLRPSLSPPSIHQFDWINSQGKKNFLVGCFVFSFSLTCSLTLYLSLPLGCSFAEYGRSFSFSSLFSFFFDWLISSIYPAEIFDPVVSIFVFLCVAGVHFIINNNIIFLLS